MDALLAEAVARAEAAEARAEAAEARVIELEAEVARLRYENEMMIRYIICSWYWPPSCMSCSTEARFIRLNG